MNLVVDIGNTNIKYAQFSDGNIVKLGNLSDLDQLNSLIEESGCKDCLICSVSHSREELNKVIRKELSYTYFDHQTLIPILSNYNTPKTLGMDRLAAVIGATVKFPKAPVMVIDIGTCITYDFITQNGVYEGGAISPGFELRFKALHHYTARLPLINEIDDPKIVGKDTIESMKSGVINGTIAEMNGMISQFMLKTPDLKVIITGGGAKFFDSKIKADIFVALEIVLVGLNRVLEYNAEKF